MNEVKKSAELLPGGDLRSTRNAWVRAAWEHSGLKMVPREKQIRLAIGKLEKKRKICTPPEYGTLLSSFILDVFLFGMVALFRNSTCCPDKVLHCQMMPSKNGFGSK